MGFEFGTENDIRRCQLENSTINFFSLVSLPSLTKHIPNETKKKARIISNDQHFTSCPFCTQHYMFVSDGRAAIVPTLPRVSPQQQQQHSQSYIKPSNATFAIIMAIQCVHLHLLG